MCYCKKIRTILKESSRVCLREEIDLILPDGAQMAGESNDGVVCLHCAIHDPYVC